jgi:hypothetical protein
MGATLCWTLWSLLTQPLTKPMDHESVVGHTHCGSGAAHISMPRPPETRIKMNKGNRLTRSSSVVSSRSCFRHNSQCAPNTWRGHARTHVKLSDTPVQQEGGEGGAYSPILAKLVTQKKIHKGVTATLSFDSVSSAQEQHDMVSRVECRPHSNNRIRSNPST